MEIKVNGKEEARVLLKEKLRVYEDKTEKWTSGTLWAKSDGTVKCEVSIIGLFNIKKLNFNTNFKSKKNSLIQIIRCLGKRNHRWPFCNYDSSEIWQL